jgi:hypothetical protein
MENKNINSIPVIGTAIVNNSHWLQRLINSVDYPTDNFVIFDNNGRGQLIEELDNMIKVPHKFIKKLTVCHLPANIGCSGAWNMIIKCYMTSPYWIIANDDVAFTEGFLEEMVNDALDPDVGIVHGNAGDFNLGAWNLFLIKDWVIQKYGLFDENFYPIYCEDADYIMRLKHHPIKQVIEVKKPYYHGLEINNYDSGQQTKKGEGELIQKFDEANLINFEYMEKKWGPRWRSTWPYFTPFNDPNMPLSITTYDLEYVRRKYLGF